MQHLLPFGSTLHSSFDVLAIDGRYGLDSDDEDKEANDGEKTSRGFTPTLFSFTSDVHVTRVCVTYSCLYIGILS